MLTLPKLEEAYGVIAAYNSRVPEAHRLSVENADALGELLYAYGAADDEALQEMTWEAWVRATSVPEKVAQGMSRVYRGAAPNPPVPSQVMVVQTTSDVVSELSNHDLVQRYGANPHLQHNAVAEQLRARSRNKACIAWKTDGTIDVAVTATVLEGVATGDDYGDTFMKDNGEPVYLYRVGEIVGDIRDEHPLYPGRALLKDGRDKHGVNWREVPFECRQLLRIARSETNELRIQSRDELIGIRDTAKQGIGSLTERYPKAFRLYSERRSLGGGNPPLKIRSNSRQQESVPA